MGLNNFCPRLASVREKRFGPINSWIVAKSATDANSHVHAMFLDWILYPVPEPMQ
jgi:hypothetical protein